MSGVNGTVLAIPNVLESDEGQYYCIVTNEWGRSVKSNDVTLIVEGTTISYLCMRVLLNFITSKLYNLCNQLY